MAETHDHDSVSAPDTQASVAASESSSASATAASTNVDPRPPVLLNKEKPVPFWVHEPWELCRWPQILVEFVPTSNMSPQRKFNAITRFIVYGSLLMSFINRSQVPLIIGVGCLLILFHCFKPSISEQEHLDASATRVPAALSNVNPLFRTDLAAATTADFTPREAGPRGVVVPDKTANIIDERAFQKQNTRDMMFDRRTNSKLIGPSKYTGQRA